MASKRKDSNRVVLRKGETERKDGRYQYRWKDKNHETQVIYARTLDELREKEKLVTRNELDGLKTPVGMTLNDLFDLWCEVKRGLKDNTRENYIYMYNHFVRDTFGKMRLINIKKSDVKKFYNRLIDDRVMSASTVDGVNTVVHQLFGLAVDDELIRNNPATNVIKEIKRARGYQTPRRKALTMAEQRLFLDYIRKSRTYMHWYPIFAVMIGTGMRVGEVTGLRWCDIDLENKEIDINHTLVYYNKSDNHCYFAVNTPKTQASKRKIPMMDSVREAFIMEKKLQEEFEIESNTAVDGYRDFIFVNRFGGVQHLGTLNKAIKRIIRDCNDEILTKNPDAEVLLPPFSCHSLRHTFATRMVEANVNMKVIQDTLGHTDISTTMNIYADVTDDLKSREIRVLEKHLTDSIQ